LSFEVKVRLNMWQPEVPELEISDMLAAHEKGVIGMEELRNMLVKTGWELTGEKVKSVNS